ncbi:MAG: Holliday junction resolvase RuvX [Chthoniobacterales bacterium]
MKRLLGIDLGQARTGIAISDELRMLAHPLETIPSGAAGQRIKQIVTEKNVECVVVGLPRHMNGSLGIGAEQAKEFADKLRGEISCEVVLWDERLSTATAERALRESGKTTRQTRGVIDQVAAQMILQGYLDRLNG